MPDTAPDDAAATGLTLWAVVFAGGIGSRFWPLSTPERPKPLLALVTGRSLLEDTVGRLQPMVPPERVLIVTSRDIAPALRSAIAEIPEANILIEPRPLGTAAALAWASQEIARRAGVPLKVAAKVDPADRDYFDSQVAPVLAKSPHVEFIGEIDDRRKSEFLGGARALLFPISWPEPFGLVMIESMACGTPVIAFDSGAVPEILEDGLTGFVVSNVDDAVAAVRAVAPATPVHAVSVPAGIGLAVFDTYCRPGRTVVFLGPSGVGKTTLLNALEGGDRPTAAIRDDGRGRHTTTHRELVIVEGRGLVLDTPGMRELQLWDANTGLAAVFSDIEALARACRFTNCSHEAEPDCAVRAAIGTGALSAERYASYRKLEREEAHITMKRDALARSEERRQHRIFARSVRRAGGHGLDQKD